MTREQLLELAPIVDELNGWARSRPLPIGDSGRHLIYHYKLEVIRAAMFADAASLAPVWTTAKCHACGGSGRYLSWHGERFPDCRRCNSTGFARLEFIESHVLERFRWHTPRREGWRLESKWPVNFASAKHAGDWRPESPGRELALDDALQKLMTLEAALPRPGSRTYSYGDEYGEIDDFEQYTVDVGRARADVCTICGAAVDSEVCGYHCSSGRIEWSARVCEASRQSLGAAIWDRLKEIGPPRENITPTIERWIATHPKHKRRWA